MLTGFLRRRMRGASVFVFTLLAIELLDELVFGTREAAWPLIRDDLALNYAQIGLLLGIPGLLANFIEPIFGILADVGKRRVLILGGGVFFALSLLLTGVSESFGLLLVSFIIFYPASGAFVSLSQAALMDHDPRRHDQNMARWTLAGSLGVVGGALLLGVSVAVGLGWRGQFIIMALLSVLLLALAWRFRFANGKHEAEENISFREGMRNALAALRRGEVLRWLTLLAFSDLLMDILLGYLALYFVDVVGVSQGEAALAVAVWTGVGLIGDMLLIPLLERVNGLAYLRVSVVIEMILYTAFLLIPNLIVKLVILAALGFFNAGWYSILQGRLYTAMPGQSGSVMTVGSVFGFAQSLIPLGIGLLAERFGLNVAMWFLLLGPIALFIGVPRAKSWRLVDASTSHDAEGDSQ
jgi:MFS transporter, FSR family, fosmidomycin resistance protein